MDRQAAERRGRLAERLAGLYLRIKGYRVMARRYKTTQGEIDLVARKQDMLVIVEIKARQELNDALHAVTSRQQYRIERAAQLLHAHHPTLRLRFDLFAIGWTGFRVKHVQEAWRPR